MNIGIRLGKKEFLSILTTLVIQSLVIGQDYSLGAGFSVGRCSNGSVWVWGSNYYGQYGNGTYTNNLSIASTPNQVPNLSNVKNVSAGRNHILVLKNDNTVWAWGDNSSGQIGNGTNTGQVPVSIPVQVSFLTNVDKISAGYYHSLALKNDGTVWAWGVNSDGQLGTGGNISSMAAIQTLSISNVKEVSAGGYHSIALKNDGTVWTWGDNYYGQLGTGDNIDSNFPKQVNQLNSVKAIAAGEDISVALKNDSTVWIWGGNGVGQLGIGNTTATNSPVQVPGLNSVISISASSLHVFAIKKDGTIWAWGGNSVGQIGNGNTIVSLAPVQVIGLTDVKFADAGFGHSIGVQNDGSIWLWGANQIGELGNNGANSSIPVTLNKFCLENNISEIQENVSEIKVFPNPTSGIFKVSSGSDYSKISKIELINGISEIVFSQEVNDYEESINIEYLKHGVYFMKIYLNESVELRKIIISK